MTLQWQLLLLNTLEADARALGALSTRSPATQTAALGEGFYNLKATDKCALRYERMTFFATTGHL